MKGTVKGISLFSGSISIPTIICELPAAIHSGRLQAAHNLLSHKYANRQQLPLAKICHNRGSCLSGAQDRSLSGVSPYPPLSFLSPFMAHSFIHSFSPPENTSQMRACACLPVAASAVAAPRGGAAATQPSPGGTRSPRRSG